MNEKTNYDTVLNVFEDYLQTTSDIEVLWSDKKNTYLFMKWYEEDAIKTIESVDQMCELILDNLYMDIYISYNLNQRKDCDSWNLTDPAKQEFLKRVQPYIIQLPKCEYYIKELLAE